jgi:hypothetical protein
MSHHDVTNSGCDDSNSRTNWGLTSRLSGGMSRKGELR